MDYNKAIEILYNQAPMFQNVGKKSTKKVYFVFSLNKNA